MAKWIHVGAGNLFRGFILPVASEAGEKIVAVEPFDTEIIDKIYRKYNNNTIVVTLQAFGRFDIATYDNILEAITADGADFDKLTDYVNADDLQLLSFTITEKGYTPRVGGAVDIIVKAHYGRYKLGKSGIALLSLDNFSKNGDILKNSVLSLAAELGDSGYLAYLNEKVTFPWSMIDKITPSPSEAVRAFLLRRGYENMDILRTDKNTCIAPFVNAEYPQYLIIEDNFPVGRPLIRSRGVHFADRDSVEKSDRMKVTACLNPLHTALAIFGCLLGFDSISAEMGDPVLTELVRRMGYNEGLPLVERGGILDARAFLDEVIEARLPNPFLPDTPQRIATDTSQKLPIRFGETIKAYAARGNTGHLLAIPLAIAGWLRYLDGVAENGQRFTQSPDPRLPALVNKDRTQILYDDSLFGIDLYKTGLADTILRFYKEMEPGKIRATLAKELGM